MEPLVIGVWACRAAAMGGSVGKLVIHSNHVVSRAINTVSLNGVTSEYFIHYHQAQAKGEPDAADLGGGFAFLMRTTRSAVLLGMGLDENDPVQKARQDKIARGFFWFTSLSVVGVQLYAAHTVDWKSPSPIAGVYFDCEADQTSDQPMRRRRYLAMDICVLPFGILTGNWASIGKNGPGIAANLYYMAKYGELGQLWPAFKESVREIDEATKALPSASLSVMSKTRQLVMRRPAPKAPVP